MAKVVTTKSVVIGVPVLDAKGKPQTDEVKFGSRKVTINVHENVYHEADTVIDVSDEVAAELIEAGHAREVAVGLDEAPVDPTKPVDDVLS